MKKSIKEDRVWMIKYILSAIIACATICCGLKILEISNNAIPVILGISAILAGFISVIVSILAILNLKGINTGKY